MWWMYFCMHYTITSSMIIAINEWRTINTCRMEWEDTFQPNIHSCKSEYPLRRTHQTKHFNSHYSVTAALPSHKLWSCLGCCCYYFIFMSTDHSDILRFCLSLLVLHFKWYVLFRSKKIGPRCPLRTPSTWSRSWFPSGNSSNRLLLRSMALDPWDSSRICGER